MPARSTPMRHSYCRENRSLSSLGQPARHTAARWRHLYGDVNKPGLYLVMMKWNPGWFSAPHSYATDRIQVVVSGTWWVNSGPDFAPQDAVPVPAGGFVKRAARTPHYDGVPRHVKEPVVVAVFGMGPVDLQLSDPDKPAWRRV